MLPLDQYLEKLNLVRERRRDRTDAAEEDEILRRAEAPAETDAVVGRARAMVALLCRARRRSPPAAAHRVDRSRPLSDAASGTTMAPAPVT